MARRVASGMAAPDSPRCLDMHLEDLRQWADRLSTAQSNDRLSPPLRDRARILAGRVSDAIEQIQAMQQAGGSDGPQGGSGTEDVSYPTAMIDGMGEKGEDCPFDPVFLYRDLRAWYEDLQQGGSASDPRLPPGAGNQQEVEQAALSSTWVQVALAGAALASAYSYYQQTQ